MTLADDPQQRIAAHRMIPVLVEEDIDDPLAAIRNHLRELVGREELPDDIIEQLLKQQRLMVIFDALSERTPKTQRAVESIHATAPVNVLVVTTRRELNFGATPCTQLCPQPITYDVAVPFLGEYVRRFGVETLFPGRTALQLGDRLLAMLERGSQRVDLSPLLIRQFVDQAIEIRRRDLPLEELPLSVPALMLENIRQTNPQGEATPNYVPNDTLIRAARVLGMCSLGKDYVPRDFILTDAQEALTVHGVAHDAADIIQRFIDNGVVQKREPAGTVFLRFTLDPQAEYLASVYWIDQNGSDLGQWERWQDSLRRIAGYPEIMNGFLTALENCVIAYRENFEIPDLTWEDIE